MPQRRKGDFLLCGYLCTACEVTVEKLLRDVIPEDIALQKETVDWVTDCATDFLRALGEKANLEAETSAKKEKYRINAEHVVRALAAMQHTKYLDEVRAVEKEAQDKNRTKKQRLASRKAALSAASHEELLAEQNALFQQASAKAAREGW